jgi:hypothetical protein
MDTGTVRLSPMTRMRFLRARLLYGPPPPSRAGGIEVMGLDLGAISISLQLRCSLASSWGG